MGSIKNIDHTPPFVHTLNKKFRGSTKITFGRTRGDGNNQKSKSTKTTDGMRKETGEESGSRYERTDLPPVVDQGFMGRPKYRVIRGSG